MLKGEFRKAAEMVGEGRFTEDADGSLRVGAHSIPASDYTQAFTALDENEAAWSGAGLVLSLNLTVSRELKLEGLARNLNRLVQDLRKQRKLAYEQRIVLSIEASGDYEACLAAHGEWLMAQILAERLAPETGEPEIGLDDENGRLNLRIEPV